MSQHLIQYFIDFPKPLALFLIAALPISELRGSIPIGIFTYNLNPWLVFLISVLGNVFPIVFVLLFLKKTEEILCRYSQTMQKFFKWLYERTYKRGGKQFERWGALALVLIVAIPLPMTGAYTGSVLATLFNVPIKKSLPLISIGVIIAGVIVTILSLGVNSFL